MVVFNNGLKATNYGDGDELTERDAAVALPSSDISIIGSSMASRLTDSLKFLSLVARPRFVHRLPVHDND